MNWLPGQRTPDGYAADLAGWCRMVASVRASLAHGAGTRAAARYQAAQAADQASRGLCDPLLAAAYCAVADAMQPPTQVDSAAQATVQQPTYDVRVPRNRQREKDYDADPFWLSAESFS